MGADESGGGPRQTSLARLREFGVVPKRKLGQNFLVDDNILRLILQHLAAEPGDVVIEVGGGLGVLTEALAGVARHVHTFEIDPALEAPLRATVAAAPRVTLHFEDVMRADLECLEPPPTLCASNLPYSVAAPFIAESVQRLPGVRRYVIMTQREVADRLLAPPGSRTYAGVSAWVQLHLRAVEHRPLSREIFYPRPNVDSSLLVLERRDPVDVAPGEEAAVRRVIDAAFHQRRKSLANSLSSALAVPKGQAVTAIREAGIDPGARAESLAPPEFVRLARGFLEYLPGSV